MLIADIDDRAAGWIALALHDAGKRMAYSGLRPPPGVDEFGEWCRSRARQGQGGSRVADLTDLAEAEQVQRMSHTIEDVSALLNVSRSSVKRLISGGDLATVCIAGAVRIRATDLEHYLDSLAVIDRTKGEAA